MLSIPHGGTKKPSELVEHLCITDRDLFDDSDPFVVEIYDLGGKVACVVKTDIARAFVDLNRSLQDMPPENPDGLIKSSTCHAKPIYLDGTIPSGALKDSLIRSYYLPYHREIQKSFRDLDLQLCIDCHSMASVAPGVSPDKHGSCKRPTFCLSNNDGQASSQEMLELLADCISESFLVGRKEIAFNDPFHGGHITRTYGNNPVPWIQVEINRDMYLKAPWFDENTMSMDPEHLCRLNRQFESSLVLFCDRCGF